MQGKVKWFQKDKGFGFIEPENGSKDVFVHISALQKSGLQTLVPDQKVAFDIVPGRKGDQAANIRPL
jgi:cold shock protein